ncbi:MAG TPA: hypothetical protein VFV33_19315, partial [Gemmatimonadaceae bacterium]|nr:hypothetical protein [Gemmatimonadaceae bacterium]
MPAFSQDGERLVFNTARWNSLSRYDIGLYHFAGDSTGQLTLGPATDDTPMWSPSGTSIAFARSNWGERANELCRLELARQALDCRPLEDAEDIYVSGWMDEDRLLVLLHAGGKRALYVVQWSTNERWLLKDGPAHAYRASPDARWVYCDCEARADGGRLPMVFPVQAASVSRPLRLEGVAPRSTIVPFWISSQASREAQAQRLSLSGPAAVNANVPTRLRARLTDARGRDLFFRGSLRWSLADSAAGSIDSLSGELLLNGTRPRVTVHARSGSVARDSLVVALDTAPTAPRVVEDWSNGAFTRRWFPFGWPVPTIVPAGDGTRAMLNNGEGSFDSGVLLREALDPSRGIALDVRVSVAITQLQWQSLYVALFSRADTLAFRRAAGRNVSPSSPDVAYLCAASYGIEGKRRGRQMLLTIDGATTIHVPSTDPGHFRGQWHTLRLQLLPDRRCGVAVNGVPLAIVPIA